jgi:hypothetical protein
MHGGTGGGIGGGLGGPKDPWEVSSEGGGRMLLSDNCFYGNCKLAEDLMTSIIVELSLGTWCLSYFKRYCHTSLSSRLNVACLKRA